MARILLVEPDTILAKQYKKALTSAGFAVDSVGDGHKAIAMLDETAYDALILELQLGKHNGLELLYEIRSYDDLRELPVIVLSSVEPEYVTTLPAYRLLHITAFLHKPSIKLGSLPGKIQEFLGIDNEAAE